MGSEGAGVNGVLVLSDHPRDHEKDQNLPLRPSSRDGAIFNGLLRRIQGIERNQFLITSVTRCMPPKGWLDGAPYEFMAVEQCAHFNASLVAQRRPRAILALGALAVRTATGMSGKKQNIKMLRGFQLFASRPEYHIDGVPLPVIATYSPTFLGMGSKSRSRGGEVQSGGKVEKAEGGMGLSGVMMRDILLAKTIASRGPLALRKPRVVHGTREVMERLIRDFSSHPEWRNHFDIETPYSKGSLDESELEVGTKDLHVTAIQFTPNDQEGFVFPGFECEWVKGGSQKLLALANQKVSHNGKNFDVPVLRHHDVHLSGVHIDLQQAWSWIQPDLPKALQYVTSFYAPELGPWKHLGSDSSVYQANDVIALAINHDGIFKEMEARGLRTSFDRHVTLLGYEMSAASMRGIPIDEERHADFGVKVGGEIQVLQKAIRAAVPEDVLLIEPKRKKDDGRFEFGFVRTPAPLVPLLEGDPDATKFIVVEEVEEPVLDDEGEPTGEIETHQDTVTYVLQESEWWEKTVDGPPDEDGVVEPLLSEPDEDGVVVPMGGLVRGARWHRQLPFSTASVPQKIAYIRYHRAIEVGGRVAKGQDRPTAERLAKYIVPMVKNKQRKLVENSGSKELAKLFKSTGDPVFRDLVEITKLKKLFGTYGPKGWITRKGYVHSTFGLADTGTGQLSSRDPNVQNAPKHSVLAKQFRSCVRAKERRVLIEIDKKSFHAQTLALAAKDKAYARISAIDVHSYMTAHRLRLPEAASCLSWSDKDLIAWLKKMRKDPHVYGHEAGPAFPAGMTFDQVRDFKSKKCILGIGFNQGAGSIYEQNSEGYKSKKEVQEFLDLVFVLFAGIKQFHKDITQLAHKQTHLISLWGYIRRFYDVFRWDHTKWNEFTGSHGDWAHGDDYEAAIAFLPANHAFGQIKEEMLMLAGFRPTLDMMRLPLRGMADWRKLSRWGSQDSENLLTKYGLVNQIHDSLQFHCPISLRDECIEEVLKVMRMPCKTLADPDMCPNGLFVDAAVAVGPDWAHMENI